jgi:hypothetical protein
MKIPSYAVVFLVLAGLISLNLKLNWGSWFDIGDVHHETWIVVCIAVAITLIIVANGKRRK